MKHYFIFLAMAAGMLAAIGCSKPQPDPDPEPGDNEGGSISGSMDAIGLKGTIGDTKTLQLVFGGKWSVKSTEDWFTVTPQNGGKGVMDLTLETVQPNPSIEWRKGKLVIASGKLEKEWTVIQLGGEGFVLTDNPDQFNANLAQISVKMRANTETFTFESDGDLVKDYKIKFSGDYEEIEDTGIYSDFRDAILTIKLNSNPDLDNAREGNITINTAASSAQISVRQEAGRWDNPFYRQSVVLKFTSTGCKFCPYMDEQIEKAMQELPDRIIPVHCYSSGLNGQIVWDKTQSLENRYQINGMYPSAVFNDIAYLKHGSENDIIIADLTKEAIESYKAKSTISATSKLTGNKLDVDITVMAREAKNYKLNVWVLEDKVIHSQTTSEGIVNDYQHNHIARYALTDINGEAFSIDPKSTKQISVSGNIPSDVKNLDNAYIVIFITYQGNPYVTGVPSAEYKNYGTIVDNAFTMPLDGTIDIRYE